MKELIERWRKEELQHAEDFPTDAYKRDGEDCADELQAWLDSLWTEITEDPATFPPEVYPIGMAHPAGVLWVSRWELEKGDKWRPIIHGIDTP